MMSLVKSPARGGITHFFVGVIGSLLEFIVDWHVGGHFFQTIPVTNWGFAYSKIKGQKNENNIQLL